MVVNNWKRMKVVKNDQEQLKFVKDGNVSGSRKRTRKVSMMIKDV